MRICLVCPYSFGFPGGVQEHVKALYLQFKKSGHQVKVITPSTRWGEKPKNHDFVYVGRSRKVNFSGTRAPVTFGLNYSLKLRRLFKKENFDLVHLHDPWLPTLSWFVMYHAKCPMVVTCHATNEKIPKKQSLFLEPLFKPILLPLLGRLQGWIAVSSVAKTHAQRFLKKDFEIIPNGVDTKRFSPKVAPIAKFKDGKINLLYVGRLEERKGLLYLLKAYQKLKEKAKNCRLIVVGDGPLKKEAKNFIKSNKIQDVCFAGRVSAKSLPSYYATADIFCSPATHGESFGIVLLEAMASGLPIVASKIPGYLEVVKQGKEGILVSPKDPRSLMLALGTLVKNKALRKKLGNNGLRKAQNYDWEKVAKRILSFYKKILRYNGRREEVAIE